MVLADNSLRFTPLEVLLNAGITFFVGEPGTPNGLQISARAVYTTQSAGLRAYSLGPSDNEKLLFTVSQDAEARFRVTDMTLLSRDIRRVTLSNGITYEIHQSRDTLPGLTPFARSRTAYFTFDKRQLVILKRHGEESYALPTPMPNGFS